MDIVKNSEKQTTLDFLEDLLSRQQNMLNDIQKGENSINTTPAYTSDAPVTMTESDENDNNSESSKVLFKGDKVLTEEITQLFPESELQPAPSTDSERHLGVPEADILVQSLPDSPKISKSAEEEPMRSFNEPDNSPENRMAEEKAAESIITEKQLRAFSRKHLLMMIRDLEKELAELKKENKHKEELLRAYQSNFNQKL